jgi:hypothetical protein
MNDEPNWYEETFGRCPHGAIKPYCAQCAGDELEAKLKAKEGKTKERTEVKGLRETVERQSETIQAQSDEINRMRRVVKNMEARGKRRWLRRGK